MHVAIQWASITYTLGSTWMRLQTLITDSICLFVSINLFTMKAANEAPREKIRWLWKMRRCQIYRTQRVIASPFIFSHHVGGNCNEMWRRCFFFVFNSQHQHAPTHTHAVCNGIVEVIVETWFQASRASWHNNYPNDSARMNADHNHLGVLFVPLHTAHGNVVAMRACHTKLHSNNNERNNKHFNDTIMNLNYLAGISEQQIAFVSHLHNKLHEIDICRVARFRHLKCHTNLNRFDVVENGFAEYRPHFMNRH